jgi:hypothetical protein
MEADEGVIRHVDEPTPLHFSIFINGRHHRTSRVELKIDEGLGWIVLIDANGSNCSRKTNCEGSRSLAEIRCAIHGKASIGMTIVNLPGAAGRSGPSSKSGRNARYQKNWRNSLNHCFFSSENPASRERKHPDLSLLLEYERCASDSEFWQRY